MDNRIRHSHIANEARRIYTITQRPNHDANWHEAVKNLEIFPPNTYNVAGVSNAGGHEEYFGIIVPHTRLYTGRRSGYTMLGYSCREIFERDLYNLAPPYHGNFRFGCFIFPTIWQQEYRVANFIRDIELNKLNLDELTTFMKVENRGYIYIRPSSFWTSCQMRFSLFTILLRSGRYYYFNSIEDALMSHPYSRTTFAAINLFFQGRRNYTGPVPHWRTKWVSHFENLHESQITCLR